VSAQPEPVPHNTLLAATPEEGRQRTLRTARPVIRGTRDADRDRRRHRERATVAAGKDVRR